MDLVQAYAVLNEKLDEYRNLIKKWGPVASAILSMETLNNCSDILLSSYLIFSSTYSTPIKIVLEPIEDKIIFLYFEFATKSLALKITQIKSEYTVIAIGKDFLKNFNDIEDLLYWAAA